MAAPGAGFGSDRLPRDSHTVCLGVNHGNPIRRRPAARGRLACLPLPAWPAASAEPRPPGARASPGQGPPPPRPSPRLMAIPPPSPARNRSNRAGPARRVRSPPPPPTLSLRSAPQSPSADFRRCRSRPGSSGTGRTPLVVNAKRRRRGRPNRPFSGPSQERPPLGRLIGYRRAAQTPYDAQTNSVASGFGGRLPESRSWGAAWPAGGEIQPKTAWRRHR
jgi:hypothetical protein